MTLHGQTEHLVHQIGPIGHFRVTSIFTAGGFNYRKGYFSAPELIWPDHIRRSRVLDCLCLEGAARTIRPRKRLKLTNGAAKADNFGRQNSMDSTDKSFHQTNQERASKPTALIFTTFSADTTESLLLWSGRGLEFLWLLIVVLVPLVAVSRDYLISATVTPEAALVKIATLRTLVALMVILWAFEWSLRTRLPFSIPFKKGNLLLRPSTWMSGWMSQLKSWFPGTPNSSLIIAVIFSASSLAISSALSVSRDVSLWGSVPGQDGYAAYTLFAYVLFFGVMVTHLKTKDQLWRLVGAVVLMGVFLSGFAVFQHYSYDPLQLMEHPGSARVTSTAGYPIFAGALLLMTISLSLVLAGVHLKEPLRERRFWLKMSLWVQVITIQALGLLFTLSRGPWVGTIIALLVFLTMVTIFMGWRTLVRLVAVIAATAALMAAVVLARVWFPSPQRGPTLQSSLPPKQVPGESLQIVSLPFRGRPMGA